MTGKRTYGDSCGIARALDIVGERWALLVVRELLLGPKRFTDLRTGLPNLSPDVLAQRLRDLEGSGVIARRQLEPPASSHVYELTDRGFELEPVVIALGRWGSTSPLPPGGSEIGVDSVILGLKTLFDPALAEGMELSVELRLAGQTFRVRVADRELKIDRGAASDPQATLIAAPGTLASLMWEGRSLAAATRAGEAELEGDRRALEQLLSLAPLPGGG
jgi:DNA-binding HxlR family transcriptional regulator